MHDLRPALAASLANIRVVLADIDGTLFRSPTDTLEHVARQLRKLPRLGIRFSVATGRAIAGVLPVVRRLEEAHGQWSARHWMMPVIAYNGAVVAIPAEPLVLDRSTISPGSVYGAVRAAYDADCTAFVYVCRQRLDLLHAEKVYGHTRSNYRPATEFNGMAITWTDVDDVSVHDVVAMLIADPASTGNLTHIAKTLEIREPLVRVTSSGGPYLEVTSLGNSKLRGIHTLAHRLHCDVGEIMCIGDNLNDVEMLEHAGVGVAVANAPDVVKRTADYVSPFGAGGGVVDALRLLLEHRRGELRYERLVREPNAKRRR